MSNFFHIEFFVVSASLKKSIKQVNDVLDTLCYFNYNVGAALIS